MHRIDETAVFRPVNIAVATISDTRDATNDTSGDTLAARVAGAGHKVVARAILRDDADVIETALRAWIADTGD